MLESFLDSPDLRVTAAPSPGKLAARKPPGHGPALMNPPEPALPQSIDNCLRRDHRLRRERDRLHAEKLRGNDIAAAEAMLAQKIAASAAARAARVASIPAISYPEELPVSVNRADIRRAIEQHPVVIVCGETGPARRRSCRRLLEAGRGIAGAMATRNRDASRRVRSRRASRKSSTPHSVE